MSQELTGLDGIIPYLKALPLAWCLEWVWKEFDCQVGTVHRQRVVNLIQQTLQTAQQRRVVSQVCHLCLMVISLPSFSHSSWFTTIWWIWMKRTAAKGWRCFNLSKTLYCHSTIWGFVIIDENTYRHSEYLSFGPFFFFFLAFMTKQWSVKMKATRESRGRRRRCIGTVSVLYWKPAKMTPKEIANG